MDECFKLTPEEIILRDQRILQEAVKEEEKKKEKISKALEAKKKCNENLSKAREDYANAINSNADSNMINFYKYTVKEFERLCK